MTTAAAPHQHTAPRRGGGTTTHLREKRPQGNPHASRTREQDKHVSTNNAQDHRTEMLEQAAIVRDRYRAFNCAVQDILNDEPSKGTVHAAARHMTHSIYAIAEKIAEARPC